MLRKILNEENEIIEVQTFKQLQGDKGNDLLCIFRLEDDTLVQGGTGFDSVLVPFRSDEAVFSIQEKGFVLQCNSMKDPQHKFEIVLQDIECAIFENGIFANAKQGTSIAECNNGQENVAYRYYVEDYFSAATQEQINLIGTSGNIVW